MVAPRKVEMNDADKAVDFTQVIQGHVSQSIKQVFTVERVRQLRNDKLQLHAREHIVKDQFSNLYVVFTSKLIDDEVYSVTAWVGAEKWTGTEKRIVLVKEWKKFGAFNDAMLSALQDMAFVCFGRTTVTLLRGREAAKQVELAMNPHGVGQN